MIANHAFGLFELAALHLSQEPAQLDEASLAGTQFNVGYELAGQKVTLRMDGTQMMVITSQNRRAT